jgi:hypothetical protein
MFTILIPVLKQSYLPSQLYWLSRQKFKDFTVIVMDSFYSLQRQMPWAVKDYPFTFYYLQLIQNISFPKRFDYSIKNNLALLAPTNEFVFLSDTSYITEDFTETIADAILSKKTNLVFESKTITAGSADLFTNKVNLEGETTHPAQPVFLFNRQLFFYVLNGFDEAFTYPSGYENIGLRMVNTKQSLSTAYGKVYHILHAPGRNSFGKRGKMPCDRCDKLFPYWKFARAYDTGEFPVEGQDSDMMQQMISRDKMFGIEIFECPNCGFGGALNAMEYEKMIQNNGAVDSPATAFDGRTGRSLDKVYETMTKQVGTSMQAKLSYLITTY